jgi:hypothetical protein
MLASSIARFVDHSSRLGPAVVLLCALAACAGCRSSLARVNESDDLAQAVYQQEIPLESPRAKAGALPQLGELPPLPQLDLSAWQLPAIDFERFDLSRFAPARRVASNDREWVPEQRILPYAEFDGDLVTIHNVRNCEFFSYRDCLVDHYDRTYNLAQIESVDFVQVPFNENRAIAHTFLTFGFANGEHVGISVEVRLEKGEMYSPALGLFGQFELMYVVADERDLIPVRTEYRNCDVYLYPTRATPEQARRLLVSMLERANGLRERPELYDTLTNNCTTSIVRHINEIGPSEIPYDYRVLLPGYADELAYELGLLDTSVPFAELKRQARINDLVHRYKDDADFSARIRGQRVRR